MNYIGVWKYTARSIDGEHLALVQGGVIVVVAREIAVGFRECCPALVAVSRDGQTASVSHPDPDDEVATGVRRRLAHNDPIEGETCEDDGVGKSSDWRQLNFTATVGVE